MSFTASFQENDSFWSRVNVGSDDECWNWSGAVDSRGYGHLKRGGVLTRAHRVAFSICHGPIPAGDDRRNVVVRHACDNKLCCNPKHLSLGTHADNMADMRERGRRRGINIGAGNGRSKLTPEQVSEIRSDTRGKRPIAADYGISPAQVQRIRKGQQWPDVPDKPS